jgi:hypothetical protein
MMESQTHPGQAGTKEGKNIIDKILNSLMLNIE